MNEHEELSDESPEETNLEGTTQAVESPEETNLEGTTQAVDSPGASEGTDGETPDVRLKRIQDYLGDALGKANTLEAMIGATNSDLMLIGYRLKQAIEESLSAEPDSLEQFQELMPAVQTYLKIANQVSRLAQLERRLSSDQVVAKRRLAAVAGGEESAV